jgi:hypothetical protein
MPIPLALAQSLPLDAAPVHGGASLQLSGGPIGTLGCLVTWHGGVFILGSGHVLSIGGGAAPGAAVYSPNAGDARNRRVAETFDTAYVEKTTTRLNRLDAGLAKVEPGAVSARIRDQGPPSGLGPQVAAGDVITAHGAYSGARTARVRDPNWTGIIRYADGSQARFVGLVECEPYSRAGDSGAAVLDKWDRLVGVHVAGDPTFSVFCPISEVLRRWPGLEVKTHTT